MSQTNDMFLILILINPINEKSLHKSNSPMYVYREKNFRGSSKYVIRTIQANYSLHTKKYYFKEINNTLKK